MKPSFGTHARVAVSRTSSRIFQRAASISAAPIDYNRCRGQARNDGGRLPFFRVPVRRIGDMELTFSCPSCGSVGHVSPLETRAEAECRPVRNGPAAQAGSRSSHGQLQACPWCMTTDLYIQKDFPQGLGLFIVVVGFAISTVFWYYEMPISAYLVLVVSMLLDLVMYHVVATSRSVIDVCASCGESGPIPDGRYQPFDLAIGERYRQERIRAEQLRAAWGIGRSEAKGRHAAVARAARRKNSAGTGF